MAVGVETPIGQRPGSVFDNIINEVLVFAAGSLPYFERGFT